ncbi:hypothetical protein AB0395_48585 [Streptosporangium sp. NPDC051023]|uniref:hypothetical protein n=1 Tax=Streptosporangium sp. NPDC051023 TaxID=3155410 RepID=UPI00344C1AD8
MALRFTDTRITSDATPVVAGKQPDGQWVVTGRSGFLTYNGAITALTLAEELADGASADDPLIRDLEDELAR